MSFSSHSAEESELDVFEAATTPSQQSQPSRSPGAPQSHSTSPTESAGGVFKFTAVGGQPSSKTGVTPTANELYEDLSNNEEPFDETEMSGSARKERDGSAPPTPLSPLALSEQAPRRGEAHQQSVEEILEEDFPAFGEDSVTLAKQPTPTQSVVEETLVATPSLEHTGTDFGSGAVDESISNRATPRKGVEDPPPDARPAARVPSPPTISPVPEDIQERDTGRGKPIAKKRPNNDWKDIWKEAGPDDSPVKVAANQELLNSSSQRRNSTSQRSNSTSQRTPSHASVTTPKTTPKAAAAAPYQRPQQVNPKAPAYQPPTSTLRSQPAPAPAPAPAPSSASVSPEEPPSQAAAPSPAAAPAPKPHPPQRLQTRLLTSTDSCLSSQPSSSIRFERPPRDLDEENSPRFMRKTDSYRKMQSERREEEHQRMVHRVESEIQMVRHVRKVHHVRRVVDRKHYQSPFSGPPPFAPLPPKAPIPETKPVRYKPIIQWTVKSSGYGSAIAAEENKSIEEIIRTMDVAPVHIPRQFQKKQFGSVKSAFPPKLARACKLVLDRRTSRKSFAGAMRNSFESFRVQPPQQAPAGGKRHYDGS